MTPQTNYSLKRTATRNYLIKDDKRIKMIPLKYAELSIHILLKSIKNQEKLRLENIEKFLLEYEIFKIELQINDKYVYDVIKDLEPINVRKVNVKHKDIDHRYEIVYNNGYYIKISKKLYNLHPDKQTKFSNF